MARKAESFKINEKKKVIVLYTNVTPNESEQTLINFYLGNGFKPMLEEKKAGIKVKNMREALEEDKEALNAFEEAYKSGDKGFSKACEVYNEWLKKNKK